VNPCILSSGCPEFGSVVYGRNVSLCRSTYFVATSTRPCFICWRPFSVPCFSMIIWESSSTTPLERSPLCPPRCVSPPLGRTTFVLPALVPPLSLSWTLLRHQPHPFVNLVRGLFDPQLFAIITYPPLDDNAFRNRFFFLPVPSLFFSSTSLLSAHRI